MLKKVVLTSVILVVGCIIALSWVFVKKEITEVKLDLPQDANYYIAQQAEVELPKDIQKILRAKYLEKFYSPWDEPIANPNIDEVFWIVPSLLKRPAFGPNLKRYSQEDIQKIYNSMDIEHYPSVALKAIVTQDTSVRAVPTILPSFKARDDYPFDRWQNALIFKGTPVLITHYNITRDFAHIQSGFVYGWVQVEHLAKITSENEKTLRNTQKYAIPNTDKIPIYNTHKDFVTMARMGEIFPIKKETEEAFTIYIPEKKSDGFAELNRVEILKNDFSLFPKRFNLLSMASVIDSMMGQFYGWGGELQSRDCSAFLRDSFTNFGIYLPRNSAAQARYTENLIDLREMSAKEKEAYIIKNATPFATILWLNGHVMLYLGVLDGRAIVAHSAWGVHTSKMFNQSMNLLGGVVITTLTPANEKNGIFVKSKTLLDRVRGMSDLYDYILKIAQEG
ncbi:SH3 domain-containing protein [Helicobacter sp. faydin-H20]|uniref:SH3 domain-containing C40 family peptidase n=1 Tax=Helicobacter anatolicus TaxID=2905874 RepID=UPI001E593345|nr:SH3 domain-containing C40 family peptidase [Helicobacter anatolicus]MCE3036879.1 SH3 domain-containing protein [Helicobacter anatolicus]